MPKDLQESKTLLVVSDTGLYFHNKKTYGFGPVVRELEALLKIFDRITWIGFNREDQKFNKSYQEVNTESINIIALPRVGGKGVFDKLKILFSYPRMFRLIRKQVKTHTYIHSRAPSNPALITMCLSLFYRRKTYWFKYAGSWIDTAPFSYRFQRRFLKQLKHTYVTVNGNWKNQANHIIPFENPCLDKEDRRLGKELLTNKQLALRPDFCFVGNLDVNKGILELLESLKIIDSNSIGAIHIVGSGPLKQSVERYSKESSHNLVLHGFLNKDKVIEIFKKCHFLLLPSRSEGFPKVVSEAMNFSCVPVVSDVSCVSQYIEHEKNGILINLEDANALAASIRNSISISKEAYETIIKHNYKMAEIFTYDSYLEKISHSIM